MFPPKLMHQNLLKCDAIKTIGYLGSDGVMR